MKRPDSLPRHIDAAIFDFDETMIDLEAQHTAASLALCRDFGADYREMPEEWRKGSGRRVIDDVRDLRAHFGWEPSIEALFALRQRHFDEACERGSLTLLPGVERIVHALHAAGTRLAITSSAVGSSIDTILRRFDLREQFELVVDGRDVKRGKPDPEAYLLTLRRLEARADQCVVFEDSTVGVAAAKAAGICCIAVRNPRAQLPQDLGAADLVLGSLEELEVRWLTLGVSIAH
jgi:beta-phosphoglucomutase